MPLYDYKCTACGKVTEIRHGFGDQPAHGCPACGAALARVFNPAPIVFKGSGFYVTDSRSKSAPSGEKSGETKSGESKPDGGKADGAEPAAAKPDAAKPEKKSENKSESKPESHKPADSAA